MIPSGAKVFLASHPVDFRKGPDGLIGLVRDAGADPFDGSLYVFRAKRADRIKIVWWDGTGLCLYAKRLEKAAFCWPRVVHSRIHLSHAQLLALVEGMDWKRVHAVTESRPQSAG
ncbi:MAG: IS66 family insertion sequence element accessory protein TnpB [Devosia sp.]|nr:IS66 family insertion sequence element accessory protein TnpB [Devosia sp.]